MITEVISIIINGSSLIDLNSRQKILQLNEICKENLNDYEIVIVNNSWTDDPSFDLQTVILQLTNTRIIDLANWINEEKSFLIGLEVCIGDYAILFDPVTDPNSLIMDSLSLALNMPPKSYIIGKSKRSSSLFNFIRNLSHSMILRIAGIKISGRTTTFRLITRSLLNGMLEATSKDVYLFARMQKMGHSPVYIKYIPEKFNTKKLTHYFLKSASLLLSNSTKLLRSISLLGFFSSVISFAFALYAVISKFINDNVVQGWSSTIFIISFLFSIQFILLALFGEYLSRMLTGSSESKGNFIIGERISNSLINYDQLNVLSESLVPKVENKNDF